MLQLLLVKVYSKNNKIIITVMFFIIFSLGDVKVSDLSDMVSEAERAYDVEQCSCGTGYTGLSCEVWRSLSCELRVVPVYLYVTIRPKFPSRYSMTITNRLLVALAN